MEVWPFFQYIPGQIRPTLPSLSAHIHIYVVKKLEIRFLSCENEPLSTKLKRKKCPVYIFVSKLPQFHSTFDNFLTLPSCMYKYIKYMLYVNIRGFKYNSRVKILNSNLFTL